MLKNFKKIYIIFTLLSIFNSKGHVCSEDELIKELIEDILDNGNLFNSRQTRLSPRQHRNRTQL
jgi:hypothetical protein